MSFILDYFYDLLIIIYGARLPVGGEGHKDARIPNPWKLQIAMPHPCKYFLRMELLKDSTMEDIR